MIVLASGGLLLAGEGSVPLYAACFAYFRMGLGSALGSLLCACLLLLKAAEPDQHAEIFERSW
jgi:hypothetical protein